MKRKPCDCPTYPLYCDGKMFLAQAYVPVQVYTKRFTCLEEALKKGTLFPELCRSPRIKKSCKC